MYQHTINLNDNPNTPDYDDGCAPIVVTTVACALILSWRVWSAYSGYAQLTQEETHNYALKVQRAWHWQGYSEAARAEIAQRVARLVEQNPRGYLAKVWREVYQ